MRWTLYLYLLCVGLVLTTGCTKSDCSEETRAAYRRDCIKLRNHSNLNKAVGRVPAAFIFPNVILANHCSTSTKCDLYACI